MISIIVPVYKAEAYLPRCVDSLLSQTCRDLEILLVDDGSPDRSGELCEGYARRDERVRVLHLENGGTSRARNAGLEAARGEYIGFMDNDDWAEPDMYAHLLSRMEEHGADIAVGGAMLHGRNGRTRCYNPDWPRRREIQVYDTREALSELLNNVKITNSVWDKLYRRKIFRENRFVSGVFLEDFDILPRCLLAADRVVYDPRPLYHYRVRPDSGLHAGGERNFLFPGQSRDRLDFYRRHCPELEWEAMANHVTNCVACLCNTAGEREFLSRRREVAEEVLRCADGEVRRRLTALNRLAVELLRWDLRAFDAAFGVYRRTISI